MQRPLRFAKPAGSGGLRFAARKVLGYCIEHPSRQSGNVRVRADERGLGTAGLGLKPLAARLYWPERIEKAGEGLASAGFELQPSCQIEWPTTVPGARQCGDGCLSIMAHPKRRDGRALRCLDNCSL